MGKYREP
jgi:hypothetical protein